MGISFSGRQVLHSVNNNNRLHFLFGTAILMHAAALFAMVFTAHQTHWGNFLFLVIGMPNAQAILIEKITVAIFLLVTIAAVFRPRAYLLIPVFLYVFFEAFSGYYQGGYRFSDWTLATHALRYTMPLAMLVLFLPATGFFTHHRLKLTSWWLLRAGLFTVFFIHGVESFLGYPPFIDLLIGSSRNLLGIQLTEAAATQILQIIGIVDITVAIALLIKPWSAILYWMAFWGILTAFSRITTLGWGAYFEVLLRTSHFLAPFIILEFNKQWNSVTNQAKNEHNGIGNLLPKGLWNVKNRLIKS